MLKSFWFPCCEDGPGGRGGLRYTQVFCCPADCCITGQVIPADFTGAMWEHHSIIDLPPNTIQEKENNQSRPPSTTGYGQGCFKPRGTDIWDKFPRNLAVKIDSKTSKSWVCFGKRRSLLGVCRSTHSSLENGFSWTQTKGGWVAFLLSWKGLLF